MPYKNCHRQIKYPVLIRELISNGLLSLDVFYFLLQVKPSVVEQFSYYLLLPHSVATRFVYNLIILK